MERLSEPQPHPVGNVLWAFRSTLKRAHRAEAKVRELKARIAEIEQDDR